MDKTQRQIYQSFVKISQKYGLKLIPGRKLTSKELRKQQQTSEDISNFLKDLREYEQKSRQVSFIVREAV